MSRRELRARKTCYGARSLRRGSGTQRNRYDRVKRIVTPRCYDVCPLARVIARSDFTPPNHSLRRDVWANMPDEFVGRRLLGNGRPEFRRASGAAPNKQLHTRWAYLHAIWELPDKSIFPGYQMAPPTTHFSRRYDSDEMSGSIILCLSRDVIDVLSKRVPRDFARAILETAIIARSVFLIDASVQWQKYLNQTVCYWKLICNKFLYNCSFVYIHTDMWYVISQYICVLLNK